MDSDTNNNTTKDNITNLEKETIYRKLCVPGSIILGNKTYIYKEKLRSEKDM